MLPWPVSLPQAPEPRGYTNVERENVIRSPMGYGPPKLRQRTTFAIRDIGMHFFLDDVDQKVLNAFYKTDLSRVDSFEWIDHTVSTPAVPVVAIYRFKAPPSYIPFGSALWWDVTLQLEIIG